jgi:uncharacterized membrane protein YeaQ/YmgE (transglycosylase-associated protein family)
MIRALARGAPLLFVVGAVSHTAGQQIPAKARAQMQQNAQFLLAQPSRLSVRAMSQGIRVGERTGVIITLLNPDNQPVGAPQDLVLNVSMKSPSGTATTQQVTIPKGKNSAQFEFQATQTGLTSIIGRPASGDIRPDKTNILVVRSRARRRSTKPPAHPIQPPGSSKLAPRRERPFDTPGAVRFLPAHLVLMAEPPIPAPQNPPAAANNSARIHLGVNDVGAEFKADGTDTVVISAFYESPDGAPAPSNIHLWFTNSNGELYPRPLQISAGGYSGETHLTSRWPATVHVRFVSATPSLPVEGDTEFDIHFVPPVGAVVLVGPSKLSVVDNEPIIVVFQDAHGNPIPPGKNWKVTLHTRQSKLRLAPNNVVEINQDSPTGSAQLFPMEVGKDTVEAFMPTFTPKPIEIFITGWLVLGLCLFGGVAGGLAAYDKLRGSLFWRIFLGILGGAVLCWLYVYLALPRWDWRIAHNTFSVFFVALIGGYAGLTALDFAVGKFGLKRPGPGGGSQP